MRKYSSRILSLVLFLSIAVACSKSDPAPLKAQTNAVLLAGDKGKSKIWKIATINVASGSSSSNVQLLACQTDNEYTFSNNDAQSYSAAEGVAKCDPSYPVTIETGTWAFTLDGLTLIVSADNTQSDNGLFSPESQLVYNTATPPVIVNAFPIGYPYPAFVQSLNATSMVLVITNKVGATTYTFTLTFLAA